jgi:hypothetical protein
MFDLKKVLDALAPMPPQLPDPAKAAIALVDFAKDLSKLAALAPPLFVPNLVRSALQATILLLQGMLAEIQAVQAQEQRIAGAIEAATVPQYAALNDIITCEQERLVTHMGNLAASVEPLNGIMGIVNTLLSLVPGLPQVPSLGALPPVSGQALGWIQTTVDVLQVVVGLIP